MILIFCLYIFAFGQARVKDIAQIQGLQEIQLVGYGIVTGLDGTGDKQRTIFTIQSVSKMLQTLGIDVDATKSRVKNIAAVMVTAKISPYMKKGSKFDVHVSSLGDATSLEGGVLIMSPLYNASGDIVGAAQGPLTIGGFNSGEARDVRKSYELVGLIPNGGIVEKEEEITILDENYLNITLNQPDFTTMIRLKKAVDERFGAEIGFPQDAGLIKIQVPQAYFGQFNLVKMISIIENLTVEPDELAKVIINERTGTVVAGRNVGISMVSISHNNISMVVTPEEEGQPAVSANSIVFPKRVNVEQVAKALNAIGASPRDLVAIFQALKRCGSLKADLEVM